MTTTTTGPEADEAEPAGTARATVAIGVLVVSAFVMILNETILSVGLHDLTLDLHVSTTTVQWLTSGFLLTMAVVIPTTGFLLERFTPRTVFLASMTMFSLGTLICALAPGFAVVMTGRVVQACGTAVMIPLLMTSIMRLVAPDKRGATMGTITIVIAVAPALGPTIGGAVLAYLDWRWMFWVVLPLAVAALVLGAVTMRVPSTTRSVPLDVLSVLLSAVGFGGILYGFAAFGEAGGPPVPPWIPIVVGAVVLVLFVLRQAALQRRDRALLDLRPFTHRRFVVALILAALVFMALFGAGAILLPLYLQSVLHADTFTTGLAVLPGGLALGLMGRPVGRAFDRVGARPLVIPGAVAMAASLWLLAALGEGSSLWAVIGAHMLLMVGLGFMMTPLMTESLSSLPGRLYSHGSAILATLQQVAGAFGTAAFVTIAAVASVSPGGTPDARGLRAGFVAAGVVGVLALVTALFVRGKVPEPDAPSDEPGAAVPEDEAPGGEAFAGGAPADGMPAVPVGGAPADGRPAVPVGGALDDGAPLLSPSGSDAGAAGVAGAAVAAGSVGVAAGAAAPTSFSVSGRVSTEGSSPPDAVITLVDHQGRQRGRTHAVDGRYRLDVPAGGTWQLVATAPGYGPRADRIVLDGSSREATHDLVFAPSGRRGPDAPGTADVDGAGTGGVGTHGAGTHGAGTDEPLAAGTAPNP